MLSKGGLVTDVLMLLLEIMFSCCSNSVEAAATDATGTWCQKKLFRELRGCYLVTVGTSRNTSLDRVF